ncbi:MAG: protein arginine kinase [Candidatus Aureabacteria bacterium]|nr:protein arginine kinase [Candidatus Auribacterota bacterium]
MNIETLHENVGKWLSDSGSESGTVLSSRVRIARNIEKNPFCHWANEKQREKIYQLLFDPVKSSNYFAGGLAVRVDELSKLDRLLLVERYLISLAHSRGMKFTALVVSEGEIISTMINEEDHLRLQVLHSGFQLPEAFELAMEIDKDFQRKIKFAFTREFGYLTACPTNVGTGLRASIMLHLPALVFDRQISSILQAVSKLGLAVRGTFGEGTQSIGNIFQISNQVTLGKSEEEIIVDVEKMVKEVIGHEHKSREKLMKNNRLRLEDRVGRAYGILTNARMLSSRETIELLSTLKLGIDLGIIRSKTITAVKINASRIQTQPAHLQKFEGRELNHLERDICRAKVIKKIFSKRRG